MMQTTSASLLLSLRRPDEPDAWSRFVRLYSPGLYAWARRLGLQHADAVDLVQDVFATLVRKLPEFTYDGGKSFRGWLWTVTRNKWREKCRRRALPLEPAAALDRLAGPADEPFWEAEFRQHLVRQILPVFEHDFPPEVWRAFWAHVAEGKPAPQVAAEQGLPQRAVYSAKVRVLARLHQELADLVAE
jgi:RNA polymerase sigma-70 factor (ECF subfamily)